VKNVPNQVGVRRNKWQKQNVVFRVIGKDIVIMRIVCAILANVQWRIRVSAAKNKDKINRRWRELYAKRKAERQGEGTLEAYL